MERRLLLYTSIFLVSGLVLAGIVVWIASMPTPATDTPPSDSRSDDHTSTTPAPFYVTTMTHMEGNFRDDVDRDLFLRHVDQMRWAMDLFDEYGAKLTFESEQSFAKANTTWELNILKEAIDNGHGVGTHADFGAERATKTFGFYVRAMEANKALIDDLVGAEHNKGLSGATGAYDWVGAATAAGFSYMDATTGFAYLNMPLTARPDGWTDEAIRSTYYHDPAPTNLVDRTTPFLLANADDFVPDEKNDLTDGYLAISGGELGELASLAEGRETCAPNCTLTTDDVTEYFRQVDAALAGHDTTLVGKVNLHIPLSLLKEENETVLRSFLSGITTRYVDTGKMTWATQLAAYEGYAAWNAR